jgi:cyclase
MLTFRVIPCLDVRDRRVTKGVKFQNNIDLGDPVEMAARYYEDGCDELVVYDITASAERRPIDIGIVRDVARVVRIPFAVGGGISNLDDMQRVLLAGAEKVSVNSLAVARPEVIAEGARAFGTQCIVLGMDPVATPDKTRFPSGYEITTRGFRVRTGMDAVEWAKRAEGLGAGEIVVNSVDADGTRAGFELEITRKIAEAVPVPVVASGGAGCPAHVVEAFTAAKADAAIVAGMVHTGEYTIRQVKEALHAAGVPTRLCFDSLRAMAI